MERRDYLMSQIEEMGLFLARLVDRLFRRKEDGQTELMMDDVRNSFSVQFGWDLEELLFLDHPAFISLMEDNLLADDHYEKMASVFEQLAIAAPVGQTLLRKELYLGKALWLLEHLDFRSCTYSIERGERIRRLVMALDR